MQTIHLSEEQVRETVQRAREIAEHSPAPAASVSDLEAYVRAAEELGIPREAMLQALRERVQVPTETFKVPKIVPPAAALTEPPAQGWLVWMAVILGSASLAAALYFLVIVPLLESP